MQGPNTMTEIPDETVQAILMFVNYTPPDAFDLETDPLPVERQRKIPKNKDDLKLLNPLTSCYMVCRRFYKICKSIQYREFNGMQLFQYHGRQYISLENPKTNFATYIIPTRGGWSPQDSNVLTRFYKIRCDSKTFKVHNGDWTFATTQGRSGHHKGCELAIPYGTCFDCESPSSAGASAQIDLRGTNLAVDTSAKGGNFHHQGYISNGSWLFSFCNQVVNLKGGGFCGWTCPIAADNEGVAAGGGWFLKLKIKDIKDADTPVTEEENNRIQQRVEELEKELEELKSRKHDCEQELEDLKLRKRK